MADFSTRKLNFLDGRFWQCPFCLEMSRVNTRCKCSAQVYGKGQSRFAARKSDKKMLSTAEQEQAIEQFRQTNETANG